MTALATARRTCGGGLQQHPAEHDRRAVRPARRVPRRSPRRRPWVLLPHAIRSQISPCVDRYPAVARAVGLDTTGASGEWAAHAVADWMRALGDKVGISASLSDLGVEPDAADRIALGATRGHRRAIPTMRRRRTSTPRTSSALPSDTAAPPPARTLLPRSCRRSGASPSGGPRSPAVPPVGRGLGEPPRLPHGERADRARGSGPRQHLPDLEVVTAPRGAGPAQEQARVGRTQQAGPDLPLDPAAQLLDARRLGGGSTGPR